MHECGLEMSGRFPDRIVEVGRAFADRAVKLGRDEARLPLHERRVVPPRLEERLLVGLVERENVHEHDGSRIDAELTFDREGGVQWLQMGHDELHTFACMMSIRYDRVVLY